jgi:hypothetical protein
MAIPKIIHWCWVGPDAPPPFILKCLSTWKKVLPDYKIICWDAKCLDDIDNVFVKEAYKLRKWAFVADYVRFYVLKKYGGIYLDSDVEVYKSFDPFLQYSFFTGQDISKDRIVVGPEAAILGFEANHPFLDEILKHYDHRHFIMEKGELDMVVLPLIVGKIIAKYGYKFEDTEQTLPFNSKIFSTEYFCNVNSVKYRKRNYAFHVNSNFWVYSDRGLFGNLCWKYRFLPTYKYIQNLRIRVTNIIKKL